LAVLVEGEESRKDETKEGTMSRCFPFLLSMFFLTAGCQPASEAAPEMDTTAADEAAIRELVATFDPAVLAEDIEAMMSRYSETSVRIPPNAPAAVGLEAIRELFLQGWEENDFDVVNELRELHAVGDYAFARGTYSSRVTPADGSEPFEDAGNWSSAWQRQPDGSWKTLWDIWNSDFPPRSPGQ
jgi:ketosteroid isomerase-like protein